MAEYIECRECFSPDCHGCNLLHLSQMLHAGKLDSIMNENHTINAAADVVPVRQGRWIKYAPRNSDMLTCSECEKYWILDGDQYDFRYCPNCGAKMDAEEREKRIRKIYIDVGSCRGWIVEGGLDKDGDGE